MKEHDASIANADLWSKYFQDEWSRWLNPDSPMTKIAEGTGARVASWFSLVAAGPIAWLYSSNPAPVAAPAEDDADADELELELAMSAA
jgi:hypothetical protein